MSIKKRNKDEGYKTYVAAEKEKMAAEKAKRLEEEKKN